MRLLQGTLLVTSRPGHGTDLLLHVPVNGAGAWSPRERLRH